VRGEILIEVSREEEMPPLFDECLAVGCVISCVAPPPQFVCPKGASQAWFSSRKSIFVKIYAKTLFL
jgi:hypothetical protein